MSSLNYRHDICVVGDGGVGKSGFIYRHLGRNFDPHYTLPVDGFQKVARFEFNVEYKSAKYTTYDTSGQIKYSPQMLKLIVGNMEGAIVMFSLNSKLSFRNVRSWIKLLRAYRPTIRIVVCANMMDIEDLKISPEDIVSMLENYPYIPYSQISVKTKENIEEPFLQISRKIHGKI